MRKFLVLCILVFSFSFCFAQKQTISLDKNAPISIYTSNFSVKNIISYTAIKQRLNLKNYYNFVFVSFEDIDSGRFQFSKNNLKFKSSEFIFDDYISYQDDNLLKGFFQKYDLTRWEVCNFIDPRIN